MGKEGLSEAVLLVFARDPSRRFNAGDVVKSSGVSLSCVYKNLKALVAGGDLVKEASGEYRWPTIEDATSSEGEESAKTAPAIPPAPAPVTTMLDPEQPAKEAPASESLPPQARLAPFAGILGAPYVWGGGSSPGGHELVEGREQDAELRILSDLEDLDDAARERVLGYAFARWPGKLDIVREVEVRYPSADKLATEILDTLDRFARTAP